MREVVVFLRGDHARVYHGYVAAQAGSVGMVLSNNEEDGDGLEVDAHLLSASNIKYTDGESVYQYINST